MAQLKIVPRLSIRNQARLAVAGYKAEQNGVRRLSDAEVARIDDLTSFERIGDEITIDHCDRPVLSWRDVLDCKLPLNRSGLARLAKEAGYRFFVHGGEVFFVSCRGMIESTDYLAEDVARGE